MEGRVTFKPLLVALAELISQSFPQLEGRAIAVSEVDAFKAKTNLPSLPIAFVALLAEDSDHTNSKQNMDIKQTILLQFMFTPEKYKMPDGADSAFFAFYDYERLRDQLLSVICTWRTPRNGSLSYKSLDVASDEMAVYITFKLVATENWKLSCHGNDTADPLNPSTFTITSSMCIPKGMCDDPVETVTNPCDA